MILVDTSVWIDYFNGKVNRHTNKLDDLLKDEQVVIGDIILAEILQGFRSDQDFDKAKEALEILDCYSICNRQLAVKSAENFRKLKKKGIILRKTTDMLIGTFCIENKIPLLQKDRDFDHLAELGLTIVFLKSHY